MHQVFDIENALSRQFKPAPSSFEEGSLTRVRVTLEGPNFSGKTGVYENLIGLLSAAREDLSRPVVGVVEPPYLEIPWSNGVTYREVAKSHKAIPGVISKRELASPLNTARVFLASRRELHVLTSDTSFPTHPDPENPKLWTIPQEITGEIATTRSDVIRVGGGYTIHDRGSGSTTVFQGSDPVEGKAVMGLMESCYDSGYLAVEDATFLVIPEKRGDEQDILRKARTDSEVDVHARTGEIEDYRALTRRDLPFTQQVIELRNDFSANEGNGVLTMSETAVFALALVLAIDQQVEDGKGPVLPRDVPLEVEFPLSRFLDEEGKRLMPIERLSNGDVTISDLNDHRFQILVKSADDP